MENYIGILVLFLVCLLLSSFSKRRTRKKRTYYYYPRNYYPKHAVILDNNKSGRQEIIDDRLDEITSIDRGTPSEHELIGTLLDYGISPKAIFHDLYVKNGENGFAQIDVAVATRVGIIVFEVKDYSGWIFGKGQQNQWTQVLSYGFRYQRTKKYRFYNPVLQNESHIHILQKQSKQMKKIPYYSVVVFYGDCELRDISFIPSGTFVAKPHRLSDVLDAIFANPDANYTDKHEIMNILKSAVDNGNDSETQTKHVENIKDMLGKDRIFN